MVSTIHNPFKMESEIADASRVMAWAREQPRRPAHLAFTAGPERQAAYWIEWAEARERENKTEANGNGG